MVRDGEQGVRFEFAGEVPYFAPRLRRTGFPGRNPALQLLKAPRGAGPSTEGVARNRTTCQEKVVKIPSESKNAEIWSDRRFSKGWWASRGDLQSFLAGNRGDDGGGAQRDKGNPHH